MFKKAKKSAKPFFLEDSNGRLYKAHVVDDEDIPLDEPEDEPEDVQDEGEVTVVLSAEDFDILKQIIAERKEMHDAKDEDKDDKKDEEDKKDEVKDTCSKDENKQEVVDTAAKANDSVDGFGAIEPKKTEVSTTDAVDKQDEIAAAWKKRYSGK